MPNPHCEPAPPDGRWRCFVCGERPGPGWQHWFLIPPGPPRFGLAYDHPSIAPGRAAPCPLDRALLELLVPRQLCDHVSCGQGFSVWLSGPLALPLQYHAPDVTVNPITTRGGRRRGRCRSPVPCTAAGQQAVGRGAGFGPLAHAPAPRPAARRHRRCHLQPRSANSVSRRSSLHAQPLRSTPFATCARPRASAGNEGTHRAARWARPPPSWKPITGAVAVAMQPRCLSRGLSGPSGGGEAALPSGSEAAPVSGGGSRPAFPKGAGAKRGGGPARGTEAGVVTGSALALPPGAAHTMARQEPSPHTGRLPRRARSGLCICLPTIHRRWPPRRAHRKGAPIAPGWVVPMAAGCGGPFRSLAPRVGPRLHSVPALRGALAPGRPPHAWQIIAPSPTL